MLTAIVLLVLTLLVFVGATVIAALVMIHVAARRGARPSTSVDTAMVSLIHRRRQRLDRRLGVDLEAPAAKEDPAPAPD
jgi:hypothetical protein